MKKLLAGLLVLIIFCSLLIPYFTTPKVEGPKNRMYLDGMFSWVESPENISCEEALENLNYQKLEDRGYRNIERAVGIDGTYVWLKVDFDLPDSLKNMPLALVIPYLHFADEVYVNGYYCGRYGNLPPDVHSPQYECHFYPISESAVFADKTNTLLIKVWALGRSSISDEIYIGEYEASKTAAELRRYWSATIYLAFVGGAFFASVLFLILYITRRKEKEYLIFSVLNLATVFLLFNYFGPLVPTYSSIDFLIFTKFCLCSTVIIMIFALSTLVFEFMGIKESKILRIYRNLVLMAALAGTWIIPDYVTLLKFCPYILGISITQILIAYVFIFWGFTKIEFRRRAFQIFAILFPLFSSLMGDVIVRHIMGIIKYPYFVLFGWQITSVSFTIVLAFRYSSIHKSYDGLVADLENQVSAKTASLIYANEKLEHQIFNSNRDLEMAALVQQKFFPTPETHYIGWEVATRYDPLSKVSGDLYDYFSIEGMLEGLALFDASGHGVAAGLITMLSRDIIRREFYKSYNGQKSVSDAMIQINKNIINSKGSIDNYLTGLLMDFSDVVPGKPARVKLASAGHPYPILYSAKIDEFIELRAGENQKQFGAIGIAGIDVSFPSIEFEMDENDILVCFTDGIIEAMNENREEFGRESIMKVVKQHSGKSAQQIMRNLIASLDQHMLNTTRDDDITVIVLKRENPDDYIEEV